MKVIKIIHSTFKIYLSIFSQITSMKFIGFSQKIFAYQYHFIIYVSMNKKHEI